MTAAARCDRTELLVDQCACPRHRGDPLPDDVVDTLTGAPFEAAYPGRCARCDGRIEPGQTIARTDADPAEYVHVPACRWEAG